MQQLTLEDGSLEEVWKSCAAQLRGFWFFNMFFFFFFFGGGAGWVGVVDVQMF